MRKRDHPRAARTARALCRSAASGQRERPRSPFAEDERAGTLRNLDHFASISRTWSMYVGTVPPIGEGVSANTYRISIKTAHRPF